MFILLTKMDYKEIYEHCKIKKGEVPSTNFINMHDAVEVQLVNGPSHEGIKKMVVDMAGASWFPSYSSKFEGAALDQEFSDVLNGNTLSQAMEAMQFTILVKGLHLHSTHALVRNRIGIAYMQQSHAVSDMRHDDILSPPSFDRHPELKTRYENLAKDAKQLYADLLDTDDVAIEDARLAMLKTIPSHIYFTCNFITLMNIVGKRLDTQEESVQLNIMCEKIQDIFEKEYPMLRPYLKSHCEMGRCFHNKKGYKANCIYARDELHKIEGYEDEFTLHNKTKAKLTGYTPRALKEKLSKC